MSTFNFTLPAASQTLAVSRTNWNSSFGAVLQSFYGTQLPAATDIDNEGSSGLVDGMFYRDSANGTVYIRDSNAFKGQAGHVTRSFTRVGIGLRVFNTLAQASELAGPDHANFSALEVGELFCTVGNSAGSANNRLYLRTTNTATGIADVSGVVDGSIGTAQLANPISLTYAANVTGNLSVTRSLAVGYNDGRVPQANLEVNGNTHLTGQVRLGGGSETTPALCGNVQTTRSYYRRDTSYCS